LFLRGKHRRATRVSMTRTRAVVRSRPSGCLRLSAAVPKRGLNRRVTPSRRRYASIARFVIRALHALRANNQRRDSRKERQPCKSTISKRNAEIRIAAARLRLAIPTAASIAGAQPNFPMPGVMYRVIVRSAAVDMMDAAKASDATAQRVAGRCIGCKEQQ
jgi:hypothetical protein